MRNVEVSILCCTYNHEKYISKAIESFLSQKTNFFYEIIIHDDASTDSTASIVEKYKKNNMDVIRFIKEEENQYYKNNFFYDKMLPMARGRFIALCDGDDYWIDEEKLQKQYDYMMRNPKCALFIHDGYKITEKGKMLASTFPKSKICTQEEILLAGIGSSFPISSSMFWRKRVTEQAPAFFFEVKALDYTIKQCCACYGEVYYSSEPMSIYRLSVTDSFMDKTRSNIDFYKLYLKEMISFFEQYNEYTNKMFDKIINTKISSDIMGLCSVVSKKEAIDAIGFNKMDNLELIDSIYKSINEKMLPNEISSLDSKCDSIYVYGTSRLAEICYRQLEANGIEIRGFVLTDGFRKSNEFLKHKVYEISEIAGYCDSAEIILAVQPINIETIEKNLRSRMFMHIYKPYYKLRKELDK